jgi:predicted Zn-dependent peptidase
VASTARPVPHPPLDTVRLDREIHRTAAPNGVTVLSERVPSVRSAAVGVWVRTASAHEPRAKMGVSHLLEHMVFKGTERRTAQEIALSLESRGGSLDAYTSRDSTAYHARVLDTDLERALDVITDMIRRPTLRENDLSLERQVVLEEISTVEDTPDDEVFDLAYQTLWPSHPYGFQILGTKETVSALSADDLRNVHARAYFPGNCIIAAAGNLTHEALLKEAEAHGWFQEDSNPIPLQVPPVPAAVRGTRKSFEKDTAQTHIVFATDTIPFADRRKYAMLVLSNIFGGGMSSRLFQRIREELGLAYAIYSFTSFYRAIGMAGVYVGTQPARAEEALEAIRAEFARLAREGLRGAALESAKQQTLGQLMLSLESPTSRMYRLASTAVYGETYRSLDEVLRTVAALTEDEMSALAEEFFAPERQTIVSLGPSPSSLSGSPPA